MVLNHYIIKGSQTLSPGLYLEFSHSRWTGSYADDDQANVFVGDADDQYNTTPKLVILKLQPMGRQ